MNTFYRFSAPFILIFGIYSSVMLYVQGRYYVSMFELFVTLGLVGFIFTIRD